MSFELHSRKVNLRATHLFHVVSLPCVANLFEIRSNDNLLNVVHVQNCQSQLRQLVTRAH